MRGFLAENPECADKMARYGVAKMRDDGFSDDEIRAHFADLLECGHLDGIDIDDLLQ